MSDIFKDNNDFVFIKEQIRPKKRNNILNKFVFPLIMMVLMAVVFGLVASVTFCIAEPKMYKLLHKDENSDKNSMLQTTTQVPDDNEDYDEAEKEPDNNSDNNNAYVKKNDEEDSPEKGDENSGQAEDSHTEEPPEDKPQPVMIEKVDADIDDYIAIYNDLRDLTFEMGKSILTVTSIIQGKDWFGNPVEKTINTTGIVVENSGTQLKLLVSLDRVKDASSIKVEFDNTSADAVLLDYETELNLAVIAVNIADIPAWFYKNIEVASFGESYSVSVGSPVIALGNPNGYTSSVDIGIITSKGSTVSITDNELDLFNTNMNFNSESDGMIVNLKGEIIGLITRTFKKGLNKDLSTVLGISKIKSYIERMLSQKSRVYCGVIAENLPQTAMAEYDVINGIYVYEVIKDSPAFKAGLKAGDIILNVGERNVYNMNSFYNSISDYEPGTEVPFKIKRTSGSAVKELELNVTLDIKAQ